MGVSQEAELRHGYTLALLNELAVRAVRVQKWNQHVDFGERRDIAWSAMAELLYASAEPPAPGELIRAAWTAIGDDVARTYRMYGQNTHDRYAGTIGQFQRFWIGAGQHTHSPEGPIVDRIAVSQIWPQLSSSHRQLLLALAVHDDHTRAAEALGKKQKTFTAMLTQARRSFLELWHEGEQPSRPWGCDRRKNPDSTDRHSPTYVIRVRRRKQRGYAAAHNGQVPPPRVRTGKSSAELGITVEELARRYQQEPSIRKLAASLGMSYSALQRRMHAEGISRPTAGLTDEVRQRKRRRARATGSAPDGTGDTAAVGARRRDAHEQSGQAAPTGGDRS